MTGTYHSVSSAPWVLHSAHGVVLGSGLREPHITTVSAELAAVDSLGDILLDDNGTTSGVDEPSTVLHLANQLLVEEPSCLVVQRAVDRHDITLADHLLKGLDTSGVKLLLNFGLQRLVVVVQQLLAVKCLQSAEHTLANTANSDSTDNLVLEIVLVLGHGGNVPVSTADHLVGRDEVADEGEDGHDDVLGDRDDVGAGDFGDGDTAVGFVGGVEVDVVGSNTGSDGDLELLGFGEALGGEVAGVETIEGIVVLVGVQTEYCTIACWDSSATYGVVMMTSASGMCWSNVEFSPSLSDVVTSSWPWSSSHLRIPSSFSVVPRSSGCSFACSNPCVSFVSFIPLRDFEAGK